MRTERLRHVADIRISNVDKRSTDGDRPVMLCNYTDVYYNERITNSLQFMSATATADQRAAFGLRAGDVLLTKDSETADDIGVSALVTATIPDLVCGYHLGIIRPRSAKVYGPFLRWALASVPSRQKLGASATGVTRFGLRAEAIADLLIPVPAIAVQRTIADFLDRETARIDALIAAKQRLVALLRERRQAAIDDALCRDSRRIRVKHLTGRITSGPRGWAEYESDSGTLFLRIANVASNDIELDMTSVTLVEAPNGAERLRTSVRVDDVLVSITAEIGSVGVARDIHAGAVVSQHVALLTPVSCSGTWLAYALCTSEAKAQQEAARYGGTKSQLGLEDVANIAVPLVSDREQSASVAALARSTSTIKLINSHLLRQLAVLHESREAVITAAVTGELDIPELAA